MKEHEKITSKEYRELFNVVKDTANRDLNDLLNKELIKREGSGAKICYTLTTVRWCFPIQTLNIGKRHDKNVK